MKKIVATLLTVVCAIVFFTSARISGTAYACEAAGCVNLFTATLNGILDKQGVGEAEVTYVTEKVYDMDLAEVGCLYDFTVNGASGYAILVYHDGEFVISEIFPDAQNPYGDCGGIKIYPHVSTYLYYKDGVYYDAATNLPYCEAAVDTLSEKAFCGSGATVEGDSYKVTYTYRSELNEHAYDMCGKIPSYIGISGYTNICVPIAAGSIIGYWDRFKPELIPDYEPGYLNNGLYSYSAPTGPVDDAIRQLVQDMGADNGATINECKSGMTTYCNRAGYSITFTSLMTSSNKFNYFLAKSKIKSGYPLMIFSAGFAVYNIFPNDEKGCDGYMGIKSDGDHAMAGYGYLDIYYTLTDGSTSNMKFLYVSTGLGSLREGYYNISTYTIDYAMSISIV